MSAGHDSISAERVARNDAAFRDANESINDAARSLLDEGQLLPVICECADENCTQILQVTPEEYEAVRREPTHFINARGHDQTAGRWAQPVQEFERYTVVEKTGRAAEIVTELNPRTEQF
jgi:hypothetical protein